MIIRIFSNISTLYAWRYITDESSLVTIINNFVLKKKACIYSEESDEMVQESSFWKNIDAKLL